MVAAPRAVLRLCYRAVQGCAGRLRLLLMRLAFSSQSIASLRLCIAQSSWSTFSFSDQIASRTCAAAAVRVPARVLLLLLLLPARLLPCWR